MTDARKLLLTRAIRGLADGVVSVALAAYLTRLGLRPFQVGAIVTGTLLGSAGVTLGVGLLGYRLSRRRILLGASALMVATGLGFAGLTTFWPLMVGYSNENEYVTFPFTPPTGRGNTQLLKARTRQLCNRPPSLMPLVGETEVTRPFGSTTAWMVRRPCSSGCSIVARS